MARFRGPIGFGLTVEVSPGVWEDQVVEKVYSGDLTRTSLRVQAAEKVNDDFSIGHTVSVVADAFGTANIFAIRYVVWAGARWKVVNQELQRPRLILRLGGVYNGPTPPAPGGP